MKKVIVFFMGLLLIALGSVHMIEVSHLGVQPFDILYIGLQEKFPITIGTASILIGGLLLTISYLLTKEKLKVGTILDTVFLGIFVDLFLHMDFITAPESLIGQIYFLSYGTVLISFGAALTIFSNFGAGPIDTFMLAIHKKLRISVKVATTMIEVFALAIGFLLGGPVGAGTLLFCFLIGPFIEIFLKILNKEVTYFSFIRVKQAVIPPPQVLGNNTKE